MDEDILRELKKINKNIVKLTSSVSLGLLLIILIILFTN